MKKYVLDASVVLCYLLEEKTSVVKEVEVLLTDIQKAGKTKLFSSFLLPLEVGNGLRFTLKDEKLAEEVFGIFLGLPIEYLNLSNVQLKRTLFQSYELKTTFYDTSYHLLAKSRNAIFVTCDESYYKKAKELGNVVFLD
ncbi:MAG: type II toxin-antitoxin system VapC family toxin [Patescibacteria group bacterium]